MKSKLGHRNITNFLASALIAGLAFTFGAVSEAKAHRNLDMYAGLGTWIEHWDTDSFDKPEDRVTELAARGVRTIYLQSGNYSNPKPGVGDLYRPEDAARFIRAAHARGMKVVAWYMPSFENLDFDFHRIMTAINLQTADGEKFDSMALDIECRKVQLPERNHRLVELFKRIRDNVSNDYALGAIIPDPDAMKPPSAFWPEFPYKELRQVADVLMPMGYYTGRTKPAADREPAYVGEAGVHEYTMLNVKLIREGTGDPNVPIHYLGGVAQGKDADERDIAEMRGFVRGAVDSKILGASLYNYRLSTEQMWGAWAIATGDQLRRLRQPDLNDDKVLQSVASRAVGPASSYVDEWYKS